MNTVELIEPPDASRASEPGSDARDPGVGEPTVRAMLTAALPLIGVIAVAGPPVVFLAGPFLLLVLLLAGPFAVVFTLGVLVVAAMVPVLLAGAILATPYLIVRSVRSGARRNRGRTRERPRPSRPPGDTVVTAGAWVRS